MKYIDITGQKFFRLTVKARVENRSAKVYYLCVCDCGSEIIVRKAHLTQRETLSCGCWNRDMQIKHGRCDSPAYTTWRAMKARCDNPKDKSYPLYGGRGIGYHAPWSDFFTFLAEVGERPTQFHTLDRCDANRNYEPGNVRWVLPQEQANNKRSTVKITYRGETKPLQEWSRITGIKPTTLWQRLFLHRWTPEQALTEPIDCTPLRNRRTQ